MLYVSELVNILLSAQSTILLVLQCRKNNDEVYGGARLKLNWDVTSNLPTFFHSSRPYIFNVKSISKEQNCASDLRLLVIASKGNIISNKVCYLVIHPDNYFNNALEKTIKNIILDVTYHNPDVCYGTQLKLFWNHSNPYLHQDNRQPITFTLKLKTLTVDCSRTLKVAMGWRSPHSNYAFSYDDTGSKIVQRGNSYMEANNGPPTYTLKIHFDLAKDPVGDLPGFDIVTSWGSPLQNYVITDLHPDKYNRVVKEEGKYYVQKTYLVLQFHQIIDL
ncbi:hypothetical protein EV368DRAFT_60966 [Lentinula lateritia]|nr:hypothetical protein EV368DRAFT_60966 [Lentinula lateritia]